MELSHDQTHNNHTGQLTTLTDNVNGVISEHNVDSKPKSPSIQPETFDDGPEKIEMEKESESPMTAVKPEITEDVPDKGVQPTPVKDTKSAEDTHAKAEDALIKIEDTQTKAEEKPFQDQTTDSDEKTIPSNPEDGKSEDKKEIEAEEVEQPEVDLITEPTDLESFHIVCQSVEELRSLCNQFEGCKGKEGQ